MVETDGFRALFDDAHAPLTGYVLRRVGDRTEADDVVAEVWTVAWRRRASLPEDPERARMYVFGIARNVLLNARRSARRRRALQVRTMSLAVARDVEPADDSSSVIVDALERLSERDREVLRLVAWDGLDHGQIAQMLGLSVTAVANRVSRARSRLRAVIAELDAEHATTPVRES